MKKTQTNKRAGFTLIEVLIVVVILGILAATVLPQFTSRSDEAKEAAVVQNLQLLRGQIQMYRFQHEGRLPTAAELAEKLTHRTDIDGTTNDASGLFGPYVVGQLPPNPYNGLRDVKAGSSPIVVGDVDSLTGWIYDANTGQVRLNWDQVLSDQSGTSQSTFDL
jgi:type II secretion system protein G